MLGIWELSRTAAYTIMWCARFFYSYNVTVHRVMDTGNAGCYVLSGIHPISELCTDKDTIFYNLWQLQSNWHILIYELTIWQCYLLTYSNQQSDYAFCQVIIQLFWETLSLCLWSVLVHMLNGAYDRSDSFANSLFDTYSHTLCDWCAGRVITPLMDHLVRLTGAQWVSHATAACTCNREILLWSSSIRSCNK